jgi:hypothetical protein
MTGQIMWRGYIKYNGQKAELAETCTTKSWGCLYFDDHLSVKDKKNILFPFTVTNPTV